MGKWAEWREVLSAHSTIIGENNKARRCEKQPASIPTIQIENVSAKIFDASSNLVPVDFQDGVGVSAILVLPAEWPGDEVGFQVIIFR